MDKMSGSSAGSEAGDLFTTKYDEQRTAQFGLIDEEVA
jgi:hypothetical protein